MYNRRKLTVYIANDKPFPNRELFVAYWHTDNPKKALIDPFFYEHVARGDLECKIWVAELSAFYTWDFICGIEVNDRLREFMLEISDTRNVDLQRFFEKLMSAIEERPKEAFRMAFQ